MVEATDELRERLRVVLAENGVDEAPATLHSWRCEYPERYGKCDCIAELVTDLAAVVAEARTEGAIAELEAAADLILAPSEHLRDSATCRDIAYDLHERAAALRGVGNQKVGVTVDDLALDEMDGNQNAVPEGEWEYGLVNPTSLPGEYGRDDTAHLVSASREHVERQHRRGHPVIQFMRRRKAGPWLPADQKGTEQ